MSAMGQDRQNSCEHNESGYPSIADMRADLDRRGFVPKAVVSNRSKPTLFDHLVGAAEQHWRNIEAKRLGGLEVDHQLELDWALDGKLARFRALRAFPTHVDT